MSEDPQMPKKNILSSLNSAILDMTEQIFGQDGREFLESAQHQVKEFNISAMRAWVDFADNLIEDTALGENELVRKSNDTVKDLLRQVGVLEEESEEDFWFYLALFDSIFYSAFETQPALVDFLNYVTCTMWVWKLKWKIGSNGLCNNFYAVTIPRVTSLLNPEICCR